MAMSAVYTNFGGMLVHEDRAGTERQYVRDPLGSLIGEIDADQELIYSAEYWPYGEEHSTDGLRQSGWGFVGLLGYLKDLVNLLYVRARHFLPHQARWLTVDPLWPDEPPYRYTSQPTKFSDPNGLYAIAIPIAIGLGTAAQLIVKALIIAIVVFTAICLLCLLLISLVHPVCDNCGNCNNARNETCASALAKVACLLLCRTLREYTLYHCPQFKPGNYDHLDQIRQVNNRLRRCSYTALMKCGGNWVREQWYRMRRWFRRWLW